MARAESGASIVWCQKCGGYGSGKAVKLTARCCKPTRQGKTVLARLADVVPQAAPPQQPGPQALQMPAAIQVDDARTLWIDYDEQRERYKSYRKAVQESYHVPDQHWPLEGRRRTCR